MYSVSREEMTIGFERSIEIFMKKQLQWLGLKIPVNQKIVFTLVGVPLDIGIHKYLD